MSAVKKNTANKNSSVNKTQQNRLMLLSNNAVGKKKSTFIKNKERNNIFNDYFKMLVDHILNIVKELKRFS